MSTPAARPGRSTTWLLLILLVAAALRLAALTSVPPGMTHDEADHGLDAWGVVNGVRPLYFTVGYGREPFFDYATAGLMRVIGPSFLAGRLTAVFFSLLLIPAQYALTRHLFGRRVALLTAAGLAVGFWPVMTGRQALRSTTLPTLFSLAAVAFWLGLTRPRRRLWFVGAGILLGLALYSYIPARVLWAALLLAPGYAWLLARRVDGRAAVGLAITLLLAAALATPLFAYLATNPAAETRLDQLRAPLDQALAGDWRQLADNARGALALFTVAGDSAWRYNIPGRPFLTPVMGALFYGGLLLSTLAVIRPQARDRNGRHVFVLAWLLLGLAPVLVTGPALSTTQAIGLQPVLYLFPALALDWLLAGLERGAVRGRAASTAVIVIVFASVLYITIRDYFDMWANAPEVRVQYESSLVAAVDYVRHNDLERAAISTPTPGPFHSQATARMYWPADTPTSAIGWFDGRHSLLLPPGPTAHLLFSGFAPLNPALAPFLAGAPPPTTLPLRPTDLDRPLTVYRLDGDAQRAVWHAAVSAPAAPVMIGGREGARVRFLGHGLAREADNSLLITTLWAVERPSPGDLVLFTHLLDAGGDIAAQSDRLDVPARQWRPGDFFLQLHRLESPVGATRPFSLAIGFYQAADGVRLPVFHGGQPAGDVIALPGLEPGP